MHSEGKNKPRGTILVDSNVLLDILTNDPKWGDWSYETVNELRRNETLAINAIIYAEISLAFTDVGELDRALPKFFKRLDIPYEAAFLAAKCFVQYRRAGGAKTSTLPDFFIGAHAAVAGMTLLTRDIARYRSYFPDTPLLCPDES